MPAYLASLPACQKCTRPATQRLYNGSNGPVGDYCDRHAEPALREFRQQHETSTATKR
jgi:hypothetical protein